MLNVALAYREQREHKHDLRLSRLAARSGGGPFT